jgi:hypothetical protein
MLTLQQPGETTNLIDAAAKDNYGRNKK